jgi:hypothetical protein
MKSSVFWTVTSLISHTAQHFRGTYCLHLQGSRVSQTRNQQMQAITSAQLAPNSAGVLLAFLFDSDNWVTCSSKKQSITTQTTIHFIVTYGENHKSNSAK